MTPDQTPMKSATRQRDLPVGLRLLALLALVAGFLISATSPLGEGILVQDEGILLLYPDLILRGHTPYSDFVALYTPGSFYLIAGAFDLFGATVLVERLVALATKGVLVSLLFLIGRNVSFATGIMAAAAAVIAMQTYSVVRAYSVVPAEVLFLAALWCAMACETVSRPRTATVLAGLVGLLSAGAVWFRQDLGVFAMIATLAAMRRAPREQLVSWSIGAALPLMGLLVYALSVGFGDVFDRLVLDIFRTNAGRRLPISMGAFEWLLFAGLVVVLTTAVWTHVSVHGHRWQRLAVGMGCMSVGVLVSAVQRADHSHQVYAAMLILPFAAISIGMHLWRRVSRGDWMYYLFEYLPVPVMVGMAVFSVVSLGEERLRVLTVQHEPGAAFVQTPTRRVILKEHLVADVQALSDELQARALPGDRLFVGSQDLRFAYVTDTFLYFLFPTLVPATRYLEFNPGSANRAGSGLAEDISTADWVVLTRSHADIVEPNASRIPGSSRPNAVVAEQFCHVVEHGMWQLLERCDRRAPPEESLSAL